MRRLSGAMRELIAGANHKIIDVVPGFSCVRGELKRSSFEGVSETLPFCGSRRTTPDSPNPIPPSIEFTGESIRDPSRPGFPRWGRLRKSS